MKEKNKKRINVNLINGVKIPNIPIQTLSIELRQQNKVICSNLDLTRTKVLKRLFKIGEEV